MSDFRYRGIRNGITLFHSNTRSNVSDNIEIHAKDDYVLVQERATNFTGWMNVMKIWPQALKKETE